MDQEERFWLNTLVNDTRRNSGYLARQEIDKLISAMGKEDRRLEPYGFKVYSQNDEDGIIAEIFRRLDIFGGTFFEIGVGNGLECNTLLLLLQGWCGTWVESNPNDTVFIHQKFQEPIDRGALDVALSKLTRENVVSVVPDNVDFLSIDVDGNDYHLWDAMVWREGKAPKVVCIEYNAKFPPPVYLVPKYDPDHAWDGTDYMGSSLSALVMLGKRKGYSLVATNITGANAFFVRNDLAGLKFPTFATPKDLYNPPRYHLYLDHFMYVGHPANFGPYNDAP